METGEKLYFKFGLFYRSGAGGGRTPISRMEGIWKFKCRAETPKICERTDWSWSWDYGTHPTEEFLELRSLSQRTVHRNFPAE